MTTIGAIQGENWVVLGYDSRVSEDDGRMYTLPKTKGKIVKNGKYYLGAAGDMRAINLLGQVFVPPYESDLKGIALDRFISNKFIPALRGCFEMHGYGKEGEQESSIAVAINGVFYEIGSNYDWCHDERGVYGFGSGGGYLLGSLYTYEPDDYKTVEGAKSIMRNALTISSKLDHRSGAPFNVIVQETE